VVSLSENRGEFVTGTNSKSIVTTDRLYLREFEPGDASYLFALNSNPDVIRYTGDSSFLDMSAAQNFLRDYDQYSTHGFGRWAVILKREERFIGYCGLRFDDRTGDVDLGFRFFADSWSHGYATEAGQAALRLGFERFNLDRIIGRAMRENLPSISVLQKLGMEFSEVREDSGLLWLIYSIEKDDWQTLTSSQDPRGRL
jgi:RimJ/RimL family protein N-acetyltransferase